MHYTAIKYLVLWNYFQKKTNNKRKLLLGLLFAAFQTELRRPYIHLIIPFLTWKKTVIILA